MTEVKVKEVYYFQHKGKNFSLIVSLQAAVVE